MPKRLTQFLYYLMQNELPVGAVCKIISELSDDVDYPDDDLKNIAKNYADMILDESGEG